MNENQQQRIKAIRLHLQDALVLIDAAERLQRVGEIRNVLGSAVANIDCALIDVKVTHAEVSEDKPRAESSEEIPF